MDCENGFAEVRNSASQEIPTDKEMNWIYEICASNGLDFAKADLKSVASLDVFLSPIRKLPSMGEFLHLSELRIVNSFIAKIESLACLPNLKELWLCESKIQKIEGLMDSGNLTKLFLYANEIEVIENLSHLSKLTTLWLNKNRISVIENLQELRMLKELNLSENRICHIGPSLMSNVCLESLDLSGNRISSLKDLTNLSRLPKLKSLAFKDPLALPNPVSFLCNYSTYVLFHIPALMRLDGADVSHKSLKQCADITVMKKKVYYHMRIRALEAHCAELTYALKDDMCKLHEPVVSVLRKLYAAAKELEMLLDDLQASLLEKKVSKASKKQPSYVAAGGDQSLEMDVVNVESSAEEQKAKLVRKLNAVQDQIAYWEDKLERNERHFIEVCRQAEAWLDDDIGNLQVEFATGGNVKFETGTTVDVWYNSCRDLVQSRFTVSDYKELKITGIRIHKITRVQNRSLKARFDEKYDSLVEGSDHSAPTYKDNSGKRLMDYLFYVCDPKLPSEASDLSRILHDGFPSAECYQRFGIHGALQVTNSDYIANKPTIKFLIAKQKEMKGEKVLADTCPYRYGRLLICKVFFGKSAQVSGEKRILHANHPNLQSLYRTRRHSSSACPSKGKRQPSSSAPGEACDCTARRCTWYVFDQDLVLPEYVVDFEYLTSFTPPMVKVFSGLISNQTEGPDKTCLCSPDELEMDRLMNALNMEPEIPSRPRLTVLSEEMLLQQTRHSHINKIINLNLHGSGLSKLKIFSTLPSLKKLILSFNELSNLSDLGSMATLEHLDVSFNQITTIEGLKACPSLTYLDISWNQFSRTREEVSLFRKYLSALRILKTGHNPWIKAEELRLRCAGRLRDLAVMNDRPITEDERGLAIRLAATSRIAYITVLANARTDSSPPRTLSLDSTVKVLNSESKQKPVKLSENDRQWFAKVTSLCLDGQHLSKISNLETLENLKWASFNDNNITRIEGLERCFNLQELSLAGNCISKIEGLSHLSQLEHLDLSCNYLSSLDGLRLEKLEELHYLAVNSNRICTFNGVQSNSLCELYASNNRIQHMREIFQLKNIPNIAILDLTGNPIVRESLNYRLFLIYHLQTLKALDGCPVDFNEGSLAKDAFGGKLSTDFVAEKLGHSNFLEICELDLPSANLRSVEQSLGQVLTNLRSLNLEHNSLTSFGGIVHLTNLKVLCLNHNHIECIVPRLKSDAVATLNTTKYNDSSSCENMTPVLENLEVLHLGYNGISNLAAVQLGRLPSLKALFLQGNYISKVDGLDGLYELRELVLDKNKIKAFSDGSFVHQWKLIELHVEENRLRDLSYLEALTNLQRLYLGLNRIQEMSELDKLVPLTRMIELSVIGNPITKRLTHRSVLVFKQPQLLSIDGIPVTNDERVKAELSFIEQQGGLQALQSISSNFDASFPGLVAKAKGPLKISNLNLTGTSYDSFWACASSSVSPPQAEDKPSKGLRKNEAGLGPSRSQTYLPNRSKLPWQ